MEPGTPLTSNFKRYSTRKNRIFELDGVSEFEIPIGCRPALPETSKHSKENYQKRAVPGSHFIHEHECCQGDTARYWHVPSSQAKLLQNSKFALVPKDRSEVNLRSEAGYL